MEKAKIYIIAGLLIVWLIGIVKVYFDEHKTKTFKIGTKFIVRVAIFGAISSILYIFVKFPLPIFPSFLEIHLDEIPILIAGFAYGPFAGLCVNIVKTLIKLPFTSTLGVGELCDFLCTTAFVVPAAFIYKKHRTIKGAIIGLVVGMVVQVATALLANIYIILPFYMKVMEFPPAAILAMCQKVNPAIKDLGWTYGLFAVVPFNLLKDGVVVLATFLVYKSTHRFIDRLQN